MPPSVTRRELRAVTRTALIGASVGLTDATALLAVADKTECFASGSFDATGTGCPVVQAGLWPAVEAVAINGGRRHALERFAHAFDAGMVELTGGAFMVVVAG